MVNYRQGNCLDPDRFAVGISLLISASVIQAETINYLTVEEKSRPFQINRDGISQGGLVTEIIEAIFADSRFVLNLHVLPVARLYQKVEERTIRNWIAYDAKVWNAFSNYGEFIDDPLFTVKHALLTCDPAISNIDNSGAINHWNIATLKQFQYLELDDMASRKEVSLVPVERYEAGIQMAARRRVQGFVEMELRLKYNMREFEINEPCLRFVDFSAVIPPYDIYLSADQNMSTTTRQFIADRVQEMKRSGELQSIVDKWKK